MAYSIEIHEKCIEMCNLIKDDLMKMAMTYDLLELDDCMIAVLNQITKLYEYRHDYLESEEKNK